MPAGYASPCPVFSVSPASVSQSSSLTLSATPQAGTDYIYTTAYYAKGSTWLPTTLQGNNAAPSYSSGPAQGSLTPSILSTLPVGTNYIVLWDWLWDSTSQCYKGPGLNQCNTGTWRLQTFTITQSTSGAAVSISPTTVTFPSTQVGTTSPTQYVTVTNTGIVLVTFTPSSFTGDFDSAGSGTCGPTLAIGASCTYSVVFKPTQTGTRTGSLPILTNTPDSPHVINLTGTGASFSPTPMPTPTPSPTTGVNYYVSPSGSGSACTQGSPCTISQALSNYSAGTAATIHFASGNYGRGTTWGSLGAKSGGVSARLVLQCDAGIASAAAAIGKCMFTSQINIQASNWDIVGFDIGGDPNSGAAIAIEGPPPAGLGQNIHVIGNYTHDMGSNTSGNGIVGCPQSGMITALAGAGGVGTIIRGNIIKNYGMGYFDSRVGNCHTAQGIYLDGVVEDNLIVNVPTGGIQFTSSCNDVASNNTIVSVKDGILLENHTTPIPPGCSSFGLNTIANNYMANVLNAVFDVSNMAHCTDGTPNLFSHNISDGSGADFGNGPFSCDTITPNPWVHQAGSAFFTNYQINGTGDYHLKSGSLGINAGVTTCVPGGVTPCTPATDFDGKIRPQGSAIDIGAYEQ
jgi:hypothetical protein